MHQYLAQLTSKNIESNETKENINESTPTFIPDYNLIVSSELHILQIHRLVWLAAVYATQQQRSRDRRRRKLGPEQLFSNALNEMVIILRYDPSLI